MEPPIPPAPAGCSALGGAPLSNREKKSEDRSPFLSISFLPYFQDVARHMLTLLGVNTWDIKDGNALVPAGSSLLSS